MSKPMIVVICVVAALLAAPILMKVVRPAAPPAAAPPTAPLIAPPPALPTAPPGTPVVVSLDPPNGAAGVSPAKTEIRVIFSCAMAPGFSWCGGGPNFPSNAQGQKPWWTPDRKTCVLPVTLQPNWSYECGINCPSFRNFKSETGVALAPVQYRFSTGPA